MLSKGQIKKLLKEEFFGDVASDVIGDTAMAVVGGFDGLDLFVLIPAMIKNLRELKTGVEKIEQTIPKFKQEAQTYRDELLDYADDVVMDTVDLGQRLIESMPGSWIGSSISLAGGGVLTNAVLNATVVQKLGEEFSELVEKVPDSLKNALNKAGDAMNTLGLESVPNALVKAGEALELIEMYDDFVKDSAMTAELDEQEVGVDGGGVDSGVSDAGGTGASTWETGVSRGPANPVGVTRWADSYGLTRGKANPVN
tara:strand:+ start:6808 stop:7572 length:765 start_codon:yes stop_codon:yes gene_type:complete